jgi:hypothetical protein
MEGVKFTFPVHKEILVTASCGVQTIETDTIIAVYVKWLLTIKFYSHQLMHFHKVHKLVWIKLYESKCTVKQWNWLLTSITPRPHAMAYHQIRNANKDHICCLQTKGVSTHHLKELGNCLILHELCLQVSTSPWRGIADVKLNSMLEKWRRASHTLCLTFQWKDARYQLEDTLC